MFSQWSKTYEYYSRKAGSDQASGEVFAIQAYGSDKLIYYYHYMKVKWGIWGDVDTGMLMIFY
jgi:hypothetical protein